MPCSARDEDIPVETIHGGKVHDWLYERERMYCRHLEIVLNTPLHVDDARFHKACDQWRANHPVPDPVLEQMQRAQQMAEGIRSGETTGEWYTPVRLRRLLPDIGPWESEDMVGWTQEMERRLQRWGRKSIARNLEREIYKLYGFGPKELGGRELYTGEDPVLNWPLAYNNLCTLQEEVERRYRLGPEDNRMRLGYWVPPKTDPDTGELIAERVVRLGQAPRDVYAWREVRDTAAIAFCQNTDQQVVSIGFRRRLPGEYSPIAGLLARAGQVPIWGREEITRAQSRCDRAEAECPVASQMSAAPDTAHWREDGLLQLRAGCPVAADCCPIVRRVRSIPKYDPVVLFAAQWFDEEIEWRCRWLVRRCIAPEKPRVQQNFQLRHDPGTDEETLHYMEQKRIGDETSPRCGRWFVTNRVHQRVCDDPTCQSRVSYLDGSKLRARREQLANAARGAASRRSRPGSTS